MFLFSQLPRPLLLLLLFLLVLTLLLLLLLLLLRLLAPSLLLTLPRLRLLRPIAKIARTDRARINKNIFRQRSNLPMSAWTFHLTFRWQVRRALL